MAAPTPAAAARLTRPRLRSLLIKAGRRRNLDTWVDRLYTIFHTDALRHPTPVKDAFGVAASAIVKRLDAAVVAAQDLQQATELVFRQHQLPGSSPASLAWDPYRRPGPGRDR